MENTKREGGVKKALAVVVNVLTYLFFAVCILSLVISVISKRDADGAVNIFGRQMRIVLSPSMESCAETDVSKFEVGSIKTRSMVFIELVPEDAGEALEWYSELKVGDVLTFRYTYVTQETITHRITEIEEKDGGYIIKLKGDNKASDANTLTQTIDTSVTGSTNYVIGKVTGQSYALGLLISAVKSTVGIIFIVIIPAAVIAVFEIIRLVSVLGENRRIKTESEIKRRDEELEAMRRELERLRQNAADSNSGDADPIEDSDENN